MNFQKRYKTAEQLFMLLLVCFTIFVGAYGEKFGQSQNGAEQIDFSSTCTTKHNVVKDNTENYDLCFL